MGAGNGGRSKIVQDYRSELLFIHLHLLNPQQNATNIINISCDHKCDEKKSRHNSIYFLDIYKILIIPKFYIESPLLLTRMMMMF